MSTNSTAENKDAASDQAPASSTPASSSVLDGNQKRPEHGKGHHSGPRTGKRHGPSLTQRVRRVEQAVSDLAKEIAETKTITLEVSGDNSETLQHILTALEDLELVPKDPVTGEIQRLERDLNHMSETENATDPKEIDTSIEASDLDIAQEARTSMGPLLKGGLSILALVGAAAGGYTVGKRKGVSQTTQAFLSVDNVED